MTPIPGLEDDGLWGEVVAVPDTHLLAAMTDLEVARILVLALACLSEEGYCAGWDTDIALNGWQWSLSGTIPFHGSIRADALRRLRARLCGGWVGFDPIAGPILYTSVEWRLQHPAGSEGDVWPPP